ncbi:MAG: GC-type dockerin domain-anchored protein [Planctomycetota bacterium]
MLVLLTINAAAAQQTSYRVTDLTPLGFTPDPSDEGLLAINNAGEVVGSFEVGGDRHAFVWLPAAAHGMDRGLHDLHLLAGLVDLESAAHDINMSGKVVGQTDGSEPDEGEAIVWELGAPVTSCRLGFLTGQPNAWSIAHAINDAAPYPVVVGEGLNFSGGPSCPEFAAYAFRTNFDGTCPASLDSLLPAAGSSDNRSFARDVNTPSFGEAQIVGSSMPSPLHCGTNACLTGMDALRWQDGTCDPDCPTGVVLPRLPTSGGGHEARDNNNAGQIAGWGFEDDDQSDCLRRALLWEPPKFDPFNLHPYAVAAIGAQASRAEAINNPDGDRVQLVGWGNPPTLPNRALLWERDVHGSWTATDLNTVIAQCSDNWTIAAAHDINDDGWIVALGLRNNQPHALLLTPFDSSPETCDADIAGPSNGPPDGVVGINDFLVLLSSWGPCSNQLTDPCPADLDCDGMVGINDFLEMLAAWGNCPGFGGPPPRSLEEELRRAGLTMDDWDLYVAIMTTGTEAEKENAECWMDHYLTCHTKRFCQEIPGGPCPDDDPFGGH